MKDYQLKICKDVQEDLLSLGCEMDIDAVHRFWSAYSEFLYSGFEGYQKGDFRILEFAVEICTVEGKGAVTTTERKIEFPMKVHVYCGHYKGKGGYFTEPPECGWEGIVEVETDDFEHGHASTNCQSCGAELTQDMDSFDPINE